MTAGQSRKANKDWRAPPEKQKTAFSDEETRVLSVFCAGAGTGTLKSPGARMSSGLRAYDLRFWMQAWMQIFVLHTSRGTGNH